MSLLRRECFFELSDTPLALQDINPHSRERALIQQLREPHAFLGVDINILYQTIGVLPRKCLKHTSHSRIFQNLKRVSRLFRVHRLLPCTTHWLSNLSALAQPKSPQLPVLQVSRFNFLHWPSHLLFESGPKVHAKTCTTSAAPPGLRPVDAVRTLISIVAFSRLSTFRRIVVQSCCISSVFNSPSCDSHSELTADALAGICER